MAEVKKIERLRHGRWLEVDMEDLHDRDVFRFVDDEGAPLELWGRKELTAFGEPYKSVLEDGTETFGIDVDDGEEDD